MQGAPVPQEVLIEQRHAARKQKAAARARRRRQQAFHDPAQALLERQRVQPDAVTRAQAFELPSQRHMRTLAAQQQQQPSSAARQLPAGALTAAGYPYHTSPHDKPGGWSEMQTTTFPSAMAALQQPGQQHQQHETSTDTHAMQFLHAVVQPHDTMNTYMPQVCVL